MSRSTSPTRATFGDLLPSHQNGTSINTPPDSENEEDELDFWGYNRASHIKGHESEDEDGEEYEDESASDLGDCDDEDDDDDGDEEDRMELFGHR